MANALENAVLMSARDAVSGSLGTCYIYKDNCRYTMANVIKVEASVEKTKTEVPILGRTGKGHKSSGWEGTGSATLHFNNSLMRKWMEEYKNTQKDFYFDMEVTVSDPTTNVGEYRVVLKDCNVDSLMIVNLDTDAEYLEEDVDFTFDDFAIDRHFKEPQSDGGGYSHQLGEAGLTVQKATTKGFNILGNVTGGISSITGALG